jgi:uncharacterized protein (TIGR03083 family)
MTSNSPTAQNLGLDPAQVAAALTDAAERVCTLLESVADPSTRVAATPGWTVAELARHVAFLPDYYRGAPRGKFGWTPDAATMPQVNTRNIETLRELSPAAAGSHLRRAMADYAPQVRAATPAEHPFPAHAGALMNTVQLGAVGVGELEVHGHDLAGTLHRPWAIPPAHAAMVLRGVEPLLPRWLSDGRRRHDRTDYEIRIRGNLGTHRWRFDKGQMVIDPPGRWKPDVVLSADPSAALLVFYRRTSQWSAIARGRLLAWGPQPWKSLGLVGRFHIP